MLNNTYFIIPKIDQLDIRVFKGGRKQSLGLLGYDPVLNNTKNKISEMSYSKWSRIRKLFNDFEFPLDIEKIHRPISRAYFKLLELIVDHNINIEGDTLHLAEAPGGFIEATRYVKNKYGIVSDKYYTFSLIGDEATPMYNKSLISDENIVVLSNKKNKGDLCIIENMKTLVTLLSKKNVMFITCDGGFNENNDFASKEQLHHHLIFKEIVTSLMILKNGGCMILKIFDIFTELTLDYVLLLSHLFSEVYICKPNTSRPTNSEKYIVCKFYNRKRFDNRIESLCKFLCVNGIEKYNSFINKESLKDSLECIKDINSYFLRYQVYNINSIIEIETLNLKLSRSQKNIDDWVEKYY
jgi:23S rRNA U2552 (ribose-2'-O)-methylase RlmE/FtsJ